MDDEVLDDFADPKDGLEVERVGGSFAGLGDGLEKDVDESSEELLEAGHVQQSELEHRVLSTPIQSNSS